MITVVMERNGLASGETRISTLGESCRVRNMIAEEGLVERNPSWLEKEEREWGGAIVYAGEQAKDHPCAGLGRRASS